MPRLSVLMPARNAAATIGAALRSTLRALPADAELLVLDDASNDGTGEVARGIDDPRVRVIVAEENLGVARGARLLLGEASGEFVARMDADDMTLPGRFRAQLGAIERGADLVFSTFQVIGGGIRKPVPPMGFSAEAARLALLLDCPYPHSTMLARADTLRSVGGYREAIAEDYDLWLRVAASGAAIVRLARPTILLRVSATQITAAGSGWREKLADDSLLRDAYRQLLGSLWGTSEMAWFEHLAFARIGPLDEAGRAALEPFIRRFESSTASLPGLERWSLRRRANQELTRRAG